MSFYPGRHTVVSTLSALALVLAPLTLVFSTGGVLSTAIFALVALVTIWLAMNYSRSDAFRYTISPQSHPGAVALGILWLVAGVALSLEFMVAILSAIASEQGVDAGFVVAMTALTCTLSMWISGAANTSKKYTASIAKLVFTLVWIVYGIVGTSAYTYVYYNEVSVDLYVAFSTFGVFLSTYVPAMLAAWFSDIGKANANGKKKRAAQEEAQVAEEETPVASKSAVGTDNSGDAVEGDFIEIEDDKVPETSPKAAADKKPAAKTTKLRV